VYELSRSRAHELLGATVAAAVPVDGLIDVHGFLTIVLKASASAWTQRSPEHPGTAAHRSPLACGEGHDYDAGQDPDADKRALERLHCTPAVREPFIAALTQASRAI
jgi:hypothetical protein